jgi:hypothetical protein
VPEIARILSVPVEALYGEESGRKRPAGQPHRSRRTVKVQDLYEQLNEDEKRVVLKQIKGLLGVSSAKQ